MHMSKRTIAYVEGNSCRDVESIRFLKQCCTLWKGICTCLFCCVYLLFMLVLAETMYLCRTLGELLRMHSGCFCYRSNTVWFWKEQGLASFAKMKCQKMQKKNAHNTPLPFLRVMIKTYETARSHSLPATLKKKILASQIIHGWYVNICIYTYICAQPPQNKKLKKQKKNTRNKKTTEPWGLQDLQWVRFLCFCLFSPRGPPQRVSMFFCWF